MTNATIPCTACDRTGRVTVTDDRSGIGATADTVCPNCNGERTTSPERSAPHGSARCAACGDTQVVGAKYLYPINSRQVACECCGASLSLMDVSKDAWVWQTEAT